MGTRGSALALAQAGWVAERLRERHKGLEVETVVIKTSGDLFGTQPPKEALALAGTKGLFVKEIEEALSRGEIDFAVHSAKDLPGELAAGLLIAAYPEREDPRDVFIGKGGAVLERLPSGGAIGSSSLRRQVQLLAMRSDLACVPMRGNVDSRLRKLAAGECEGLVLAAAGLNRLGRAEVARAAIPVESMVPAPGQGALALQTRADGGARELIAALDHEPTRLAVECERAFLKALGGGCSVPLGAYARRLEAGIELLAFYSESDGSRPRRARELCADPARRESFGAELAQRLRG